LWNDCWLSHPFIPAFVFALPESASRIKPLWSWLTSLLFSSLHFASFPNAFSQGSGTAKATHIWFVTTATSRLQPSKSIFVNGWITPLFYLVGAAAVAAATEDPFRSLNIPWRTYRVPADITDSSAVAVNNPATAAAAAAMAFIHVYATELQ
jgi:hypothetical protein